LAKFKKLFLAKHANWRGKCVKFLRTFVDMFSGGFNKVEQGRVVLQTLYGVNLLSDELSGKLYLFLE